jgi:diguanylate cyclase (GGDEF)-like protein
LTDLHNRRAFINLTEQEMARARRNGQPISILMVDIDHFKHINDQYGHALGDLVLKDIASLLRSTLREQDLLCRWGGEEFVMLLSDTDLDEALTVAERARQSIEQAIIEIQGASLHITVTIGVARVGDDLDQAVDAADQAMYEGKRAGRNRVSALDSGTGNSK